MARHRPHITGYERLAQAENSDESDTEPLAASTASLQPASAPRHATTIQPRSHSGMVTPKANGSHVGNTGGRRPGGNRRPGTRATRSNSGVDLKAINARLERWADEIASKFRRTGRPAMGDGDEEPLEIHYSVFQAPEGVRPVTAEALACAEPGYMTREQFATIVESVRVAIGQGTHPTMISQGSSGSYFARNTEGKVVGVFKPKDEEPYAAGNPKWNKWIHRNLFPCCFGRTCLIPNLSYVSEAAAYVLDAQLRTHLVPYTDVVYLSSKSFHYPFWDRYNYSRKGKPLPAKPGSFQVFLKGFKDANVFLREHPWPDQYLSGFRTNDAHRSRRRGWRDTCKPIRLPSYDGGGEQGPRSPASPGPGNFVWTPTLKQSFREELEKLVILDYIMRNTDRGLDNWMIKVDWQTQEVSIVSEPMLLNTGHVGQEGARPVAAAQMGPPKTRASHPYKTQKPMDASSPAPSYRDADMTVGAIDNSLSWPWKHPDGWRSFPFGWLFLPVDLIGRPFSPKTRDHFLPLLTSTKWWSQTHVALRKVFQMDPDFQERMFARQMAVMKGQAWNVVETLKTPDHGPLELTRRAKVCVWDDLVDVPVAFPMRATSAEMHRRAADLGSAIDEEMDIGAGARPELANRAPVENLVDLVDPVSPRIDLPNPGRFEIATPPLPDDSSPTIAPSEGSLLTLTAADSADGRPNMARGSRSQGPFSTAGRDLSNVYSPELARRGDYQRRFSFTSRREGRHMAGRRHGPDGGSSSHRGRRPGFGLDDDDEDGGGGSDGDALEGDLGYAAAQGMEGNRRKVIVERLEPVKTRNPVFTWC